uniref:uncharacterized protein isoform X2 n=1 Tax=Stichopus japonicus TaxID=307972 RepID=UPI003AB7C31D
MIWGITLQPGEVCTQTVNSQLHLTLVSLECRPSKVFERTTPVAFLVLKTTSCENVLCTLGRNQPFQQSLDLVFQDGEEVTFKVEGTGVVYITGYTPVPLQESFDNGAIPAGGRTAIASGELEYEGEDMSHDMEIAPVSSSAENVTEIKQEEDGFEQTPEEGFAEETLISGGHNEVPIEINVNFPELEEEAPEGVYTEGKKLVEMQGEGNIKEELQKNTEIDDEAISADKEDEGDDRAVSRSDFAEMPEGMCDYVTIVASLGTDEDDNQMDENEATGIRESGNSNSNMKIAKQEQETESSGSETLPSGGCEESSIPKHQNEAIPAASSGDHRQAVDEQRSLPESLDISNQIDKSLQCGFCGHIFGNQSLLEKHERLHTVVRPFKCQFCDKSYAHRANVIIHERTHTGERPFRCRFCGKGFIQKYVQRVHERIHTGEKPHQCSVCGKAFVQKQHLTAHKRTHTGINTFKCHICGKTFAQNASLVIHRRKHSGDQLLQCPQCDKSFIGQASLHEHAKTHANIKKYKCQICEEAFHEMSHLTEHENAHSSVQPFQCEHCNKFFGTEYSLRVHLKRMHTIGRLFKCQFCDKSYTQRANLINHVRRHTGEKPFQCRFCNKAFIQKYGLTVHERTHTGEKPFQCNICGKAFTQSAHMIYHKKTHNKNVYDEVGFENQKVT